MLKGVGLVFQTPKMEYGKGVYDMPGPSHAVPHMP